MGDDDSIPTAVAIEIPPGSHNGFLKSVTRRTQPYDYTDFTIEFPQFGNQSVSFGRPTKLVLDDSQVPKSKLAETLDALGLPLVDDKKVIIKYTIATLNTALTGLEVSALVGHTADGYNEIHQIKKI